MTSDKFCGLPEELTVKILENLDGVDLMSCSLVCHLFHTTILNTSVLQYNTELTLAGAEDGGPASRLPTVARLAALKTSQRAWATLRPRQRHTKLMALSNIWELFGGVIARGVATNPARGLSFVALPSAVRNTPARTWTHHDLGLHIRDFAIDPAQDLAVLIAFPEEQTYTIHLRAMTSGRAHPRATDAVLQCVQDSARQCEFVIQVMGAYLAVLFHASYPRGLDQLFVWDWRAGKVVAELKTSSRDKIRIDYFSFLSPRHFVVSRFRNELLRTTTPMLEVYDFLADTPTLVRYFEFPTMVDCRTMITRSDPPPHSPALSSDAGAPFCTAAASRVLAVSVGARRRQYLYSYVLFVHHSTLLEGLESGYIPSPGDLQVPWEKWGPQKSRMISTLYNDPTWVCYMHGMKYVRLEPQNDVDDEFSSGSRVRMLDFNAHSLHRKYTDSDDEEDFLPHDEIYPASRPTVIPADDVFEHDVVTTLPYRDICSNEVFNYTAIMIDEECLVGLLPDEMGVTEGFEFLCF